MSKTVSRAVYQKKAEEAKKLRADLKAIVLMKPGSSDVWKQYRDLFRQEDALDNALRDYARNHYQRPQMGKEKYIKDQVDVGTKHCTTEAETLAYCSDHKLFWHITGLNENDRAEIKRRMLKLISQPLDPNE